MVRQDLGECLDGTCHPLRPSSRHSRRRGLRTLCDAWLAAQLQCIAAKAYTGSKVPRLSVLFGVIYLALVQVLQTNDRSAGRCLDVGFMAP